MKYRDKIICLFSVLVCGFGFMGGLLISYDNLMTDKSCPSLGFIPACYVVAIGYALMLIATIIKKEGTLLQVGCLYLY